MCVSPLPPDVSPVRPSSRGSRREGPLAAASRSLLVGAWSLLPRGVLALLGVLLYALLDLLSSCLIASMSSSLSLVSSFLISSKMSCFSRS